MAKTLDPQEERSLFNALVVGWYQLLHEAKIEGLKHRSSHLNVANFAEAEAVLSEGRSVFTETLGILATFGENGKSIVRDWQSGTMSLPRVLSYLSALLDLGVVPRPPTDCADKKQRRTWESERGDFALSLRSVTQKFRRDDLLAGKPEPPAPSHALVAVAEKPNTKLRRRRRNPVGVERLAGEALGIFARHPDWPQGRIAKELGISRTYLQGLCGFKTAWKREAKGKVTDLLHRHNARDHHGRFQPRI